jgi:galactonate dehydratase
VVACGAASPGIRSTRAYEVDVAPHDFYGDLASLMSAQFCAAIPHFRIMEHEVDDVPWKSALVSHPLVIENGELVVSLRPGGGADINEDTVRAHLPKGRARDRA